MTPEARLYDYRLEHLMLGEEEINPCQVAAAAGISRWRQPVQYAVGHTLNDFYSLTPEVRRETPVQFLLERRWPSERNLFPSLLQYWDIKNAVADTLMRIVPDNHMREIPFMRYEQWHVPVPELNLELSMIFQLAFASQVPGRSLVLQKFMVATNEEVMKGIVHMMNVFCLQAYGKPPESVEIYSLLDGRKHCFAQEPVSYRASLDYLHLLATGTCEGRVWM